MAYIDREKFLKNSAECFGHFGILVKAIEEIADKCTTADVVEVVRCKDCKHCFHVIRPNYERYECTYYGSLDEVVDYVDSMHYCSLGERR